MRRRSRPPGVTVAGGEVAQDDLAGNVTAVSAGTFPPGPNVDGYHLAANGGHLLSFDVTLDLGGGVTAGPADLVRFDGAAFSLFFTAATAGVPAGLDLDAAHHVAATGRLLLSFDGSGSVGAVTFNKEDVLEFDPATGGWTLFYRGAARHAGWAGANLDALWATTNAAPVVTSPQSQTTAEGSAVSLAIAATDADGDRLSYTATGLPAGLAMDPMTGEISGRGPADVVRFDGTSYSVVFSAAASGIPNGVNVDAVAMIGADLPLSFDTTVSLPGGLTASPADLVRFDGVSFTLFFGGATAGAPAGLDLDAAHYAGSTERLLLSFDGAGTVGSVTFNKEDVLEFDPATGGWTLVYRGAARHAGWAGANLNALWATPTAGSGPL